LSYRSIVVAFKAFMTSLGSSAFPISELSLQLFLSKLSSNDPPLRPGYFSRVISALKFVSEAVDLPFPDLSSFSRRVLRGAKLLAARSTVPLPPRLPITKDLINLSIIPNLPSSLSSFNKLMVTTALLFGNAALLRLSEFLKTRFNSNPLLIRDLSLIVSKPNSLPFTLAQWPHSPSDLHKNDDISLLITIRAGKTDPLRKGASAVISDRKVIDLLIRYLEIKRRSINSTRPLSRHAPVFTFKDGSSVPSSFFTSLISNILRPIFAPNSFRGISVRSGGATDLSLQGESAETIRRKGRWSSNSNVFTRYIRPLPQRR
jgi:hypothetical protein